MAYIRNDQCLSFRLALNQIQSIRLCAEIISVTQIFRSVVNFLPLELLEQVVIVMNINSILFAIE